MFLYKHQKELCKPKDFFISHINLFLGLRSSEGNFLEKTVKPQQYIFDLEVHRTSNSAFLLALVQNLNAHLHYN